MLSFEGTKKNHRKSSLEDGFSLGQDSILGPSKYDQILTITIYY